MAPVNESANMKLSFAKVAASRYVPPTANNSNTSSDTNPKLLNSSATTQHRPPVNAAKPQVVNGSTPYSEDHAQNSDDGSSGQENRESLPSPYNVSTNGKPARPSIAEDGTSKHISNDDGSTQVSSDGSAKIPSFDTKSVASGATFGLDEKESLRPDDSASIRAATVEEEDAFSLPGSIPPGSRGGSDSGAKAFRDQLHEIAYMSSIPQRAGVVGPHMAYPSVVTPMGASSSLAKSNSISANQPGSISNPAMLASGPDGGLPDEKLLEALQSQRDRVWVLKLEQDIIDFVGQSKETTLTLPQCNAFYRMLAHKLADYYRLDHIVDHLGTGSAVIITRTPFCRIPLPLSGLPNPSTASSTPPPVITNRKIMRRNDNPKTSENSTAANSEGQSAATSDVDSGVNDEGKPKSALTREEREAKYAEVRERIFGKAEAEAEVNEAANTTDNGDSRASSTNGKKKPKKPRNPADDDFEPRSQFPGVYGTSYGPSPYNGDQFYYPQYSNVMQGQQFASMPQNVGAPANYSAGYQQMIQPGVQGQYSWGAQPMGMQPPSMGVPGYGQQPNYDLSAHFQGSMQSFQSAGASNPMGVKMPSSPMVTYPGQQFPVSPQTGTQWQQVPYDANYQYGQQNYMQPAYVDRSGAPGGMAQPPNYPYSQYPPAYPAAMQPKHQHPLPGSYNHQSFNPQTQAFIPGGQDMRVMSIPGPTMMQYNQYPHPGQMPQIQRTAQSANNSAGPSTYGSPRPPATMTSVPITVNGTAASAASHTPATSNPTSEPSPPTAGASKPVSEITAKWGTPAHLPPKPPPPQSMEPHKYNEINRGLPSYPGVPRMPSSGFNAATGRGTS